MEITKAKFASSFLGVENTMIDVIIDGEEGSVPIDLGNRHYREIMRQVDAGELTIEPADE